MCRVVAYLGSPLSLDDLLYRSDSSLVRQTLNPRMLHMLNLAGFGMAAWDPGLAEPGLPLLYRSTTLPSFDRNLKGLARKLRASALVAHVRGVPDGEVVTVGEQNLHPFHFPGLRWVLAHNGSLRDFGRMRFALLEHVRPEFAALLRGDTDSEWIYAVLVSQLEETRGDIEAAVRGTLQLLREVRARFAISTSSSANLFLSDGERLVAVRFTFDFGCYEAGEPHETSLSYISMWYTAGSDYGFEEGEWKMRGAGGDSILLASEPLTRDTSRWLEVPEYSMVQAWREDGRLRVQTTELDV